MPHARTLKKGMCVKKTSTVTIKATKTRIMASSLMEIGDLSDWGDGLPVDKDITAG